MVPLNLAAHVRLAGRLLTRELSSPAGGAIVFRLMSLGPLWLRKLLELKLDSSSPLVSMEALHAIRDSADMQSYGLNPQPNPHRVADVGEESALIGRARIPLTERCSI